jgi:hypothetical protein
MLNSRPKPWRVMRSTITHRDPWLTVRSDACRTGRGQTLDPYHVLEFSDWVNVVALTPDSAIVLVHEYRHVPDACWQACRAARSNLPSYRLRGRAASCGRRQATWRAR